MIISDLNYMEIVSVNAAIEGGFAISFGTSKTIAVGEGAQAGTGGRTIAIDGPVNLSATSTIGLGVALIGGVESTSLLGSYAG